MKIRIATRKSELALFQANLVAEKLMEKNMWNKDLMDDLVKTMSDASICGLGQAAGNPISCVLKYFKDKL